MSTPIAAAVHHLAQCASAIFATEAAGQAMTREQWYAFTAACDELWVADPREQLAALRSESEFCSPTGTHGPFVGERCVYCYCNRYDVDLYAVDGDTCPPTWQCGDTGPEPLSACELPPEHGEDHRQTRWIGPHVPDDFAWGEDDFEGEWPYEGPTHRIVLTWPRSAAGGA